MRYGVSVMPHIPSDYDNVFEKKLSLSERFKMATLVAVISYLTLIGWVVAMIIYDKHQSSLASFHLRQSLGLIITGAILSLIPLVGWVLNIGVLLGWIVGLYSAIQGQEYKVPLLGDFYQEHLDFIQ
jgi:uncharacterized membrane protein